METLKFRAWDKSQKYMAVQGTPDLETIKSFFFHFGDCPLMLFTGKKDRDGIEIYEGDFLKEVTNPHMENWESVSNYDPIYDRWEVKWDSHINGFNCFPNHALSEEEFDIAIQQLGGLITWPSRDVLMNSTHYKIIGNIYQNPDLLHLKI